jgi:hypothetical protein
LVGDVKKQIQSKLSIEQVAFQLLYGSTELDDDAAAIPDEDDIDLTMVKKDPKIAKLIVALSAVSPWGRRAAAIELGKIGEAAQSAANALFALGQDEGSILETRIEAFRALGKLESVESELVQELAKLMETETADPEIRVAAAHASARLWQWDGIEYLTELLKLTTPTTKSALEAMGDIGQLTGHGDFAQKAILELVNYSKRELSNPYAWGRTSMERMCVREAMKAVATCDSHTLRPFAPSIYDILMRCHRHQETESMCYAMVALCSTGEGALAFIDDIVLVAQDPCYAFDWWSHTKIRVCAARYVAQHGFVAEALAVLEEVSSNKSANFGYMAREVYEDLCRKGVVDGKTHGHRGR